MSTQDATGVTTLLDRSRAGDPEAPALLVHALYDELHHQAERLMRHERSDHTLQPTALVHEAMLRLFESDALEKARSRSYVLGVAARTMRQVLVDHARSRKAAKRGRDRRRVPLDEALVYYEGLGLDIVALHEALKRLAELDSRQAAIVDLRFFAGLSIPEVAEVLGVSTTTVETDWRLARAWLFNQMGGAGP